MDKTEIIAPATTVQGKAKAKAKNLLEFLLSILMVAALAFVMLWNWDGFWQTKIPALTTLQSQYFPVKFKEEQVKLANTGENLLEIERAKLKVEELKGELKKVTRELADTRSKLHAAEQKVESTAGAIEKTTAEEVPTEKQ